MRIRFGYVLDSIIYGIYIYIYIYCHVLLNEYVTNTWCLGTSEIWHRTIGWTIPDVSGQRCGREHFGPPMWDRQVACSAWHQTSSDALPSSTRTEMSTAPSWKPGNSHGLTPANMKPNNATQFPAKMNPIDTPKMYYYHNNFYSSAFQVVLSNTILFQQVNVVTDRLHLQPIVNTSI